MKYTVRKPIWLMILVTVVFAPFSYCCYKFMPKSFSEIFTDKSSFFIFIAFIASTLSIVYIDVPKVLVFNDYVLVRYLIIFIKYSYTDLEHIETVKKESRSDTGITTYYVTNFYRKGKVLFKIETSDTHAKQFIFECQQKNLKEHLKS